ncbi:GntR family transcriptional regulator [Leifsonia shinshuensis]|uniref:GntR family transcriptional regulator n=1 Tax=Leifsonia shinshuensis TaxID=150026 RepID=UPI001F5154E7|nr:GntR family transcriptional regulator [Leifsonia shinshuensis]MCI0158796.1 GntR family transcriptional regulator [Leifsonia shinshuensis]
MENVPLDLGPARRRLFADEVTDQMREAIMTGALPPGAWLREDRLATQMNVSRGPVREAFAKLEREGLVQIEPFRGARVVELYRSDLDEIFSLRKALESLAVQWAATHATAEELAELGATLDRFAATPAQERTPELIAEVDIAFHDELVAASHHQRLQRAWEGLRGQIYAFLVTRMSLRKDYDDEWEPDHRAIVDALVAGRADDAVERIQHHVEASYGRVVKAMEQGE